MQERKPLQKNAPARKLTSKIDIAQSGRLALSAEEQKRLNTALIRAVQNGVKEKILQLIKAGANIAATDNDGLTALHHAAIYGRTKLCSLILTEYARASGNVIDLIETKDNSGWTSIYRASMPGHTQTAQFLEDMELLADATGNAFMKSFGECLAT